MRGAGINIEWDEGAIQCLRSLWADGLSSAAIGRRMGRSKNSIVGKAHRLDLPGRPDPIARDGIVKPRIHRTHRAGAVTLPLFDRWCAQCGGLLGIEQARFCTVTCDLLFIAANRPITRQPRAPKTERKIIEPAPAVGATGECCFPLNDGRPWRFCCEPTEPGKPYCTKHWKATHVAQRMVEPEWIAARLGGS
jgi:GcrA cell cycle regulator